MKALSKMTNKEKGRLFACWFPEMLPALVEAIGGAQQYLVENEKDLRDNWDNAGITFDFWMHVAKDVKKAIYAHRSDITKRPKVFAAALFQKYNALFTIDCIIRYKYIPQNVKFVQAVRLLFEIG